MPLPTSVLAKYKNHTFVETGTLYGEAVERAVAAGFQEIHSIDIDPGLTKSQQDKYKDRSNMHFYCGSSADVLKRVLTGLEHRATIWLDAHPTGDLSLKNTPVMAELEAINDYICHLDGECYWPVVMLDDMRLFSQEDRQHIAGYMSAWTCSCGSLFYEDTPVGIKDIIGYNPGNLLQS